MTARISVLPDALADQIAAGEVVERPASVVKELLENALDAGAARIRVEIEAGGLGRVLVVDDGVGMTPEDAALCVQRHATSKLRTAEELSALRTLGFRGEALPSIASVSRFALTTREREAVSGTRVEVEGGGSARLAPIGCPAGTSVEVRDLFFNVPARLKFLKSRATETGHVTSVVTRAALSYPAIGFVLFSDKRRAREYLPAQSFGERASAVLIGEPLTVFEAEDDRLHVHAALSLPERARAGAGGLSLIVNGRPVRDLSLARSIAFAYGSVLPPGRFPVGAVHLTLDPDQIDVNVHPQKLEVRFASGRAVFDAITRLVAKQLGTSAFRGPSARSGAFWDDRLQLLGGLARPSPTQIEERRALEGNDGWGLGLAPRGSTEQPGESAQAALHQPVHGTPIPQVETLARDSPTGFFGGLRVLGQVRRMLLVCEGPDAIHFIDQHAADERVRYDRLRKSYAARRVEVQRLLFPERVECTQAEAAVVEARQAELAELGLDCTLIGPTTVAVHSVPSLLTRAAPMRLLRDVLDELERKGERAFSDAVDTAFATMACHAAIRAGDALTPEQATSLLRNLDQVSDFAGHCPHGRPIVESVSLAAIERKLGR